MRLIIPEEGKLYLQQIAPLSPLLARCSGSSGQACLLGRPQGDWLLSMPYNLYVEFRGIEAGIPPLHEPRGVGLGLLTKSVELGRYFSNREIPIIYSSINEPGGIDLDLLMKSIELGRDFSNRERLTHGYISDHSFLPGNESFDAMRKEIFSFEKAPGNVDMHNRPFGLFFPSLREGETGFLCSTFSHPEINDYLEEIDRYFTSEKTSDPFLQVVSSTGKPLTVFTPFPSFAAQIESLVETLRLHANPEYGRELLRRRGNRDGAYYDLNSGDLVFLD